MKRVTAICICLILLFSSTSVYLGAATSTQVPDGSGEEFQETLISEKSSSEGAPLSPGPGPQPGVQFYYTDRLTFDLDAGPLPFFEDFEDALDNVSWGGGGFDAPLDENTSNEWFQPGDIEPGIQFWDIPTTPNGLSVDGPPGLPSVTVCTNTFSDSMDIVFYNNDVYAVGMDLQSYFSPTTVDVSIYTTGDVLLDTVQAPADNAGIFWGVISEELITRINLFSPTTTNGADNIAFGVRVLPTYNVSLSEGWNLVSFPLIQSNNGLNEILETINGKWDYIQAWDSLDPDHWKTNCISRPDELNDLNMLNRKMGFWINITEPNVILTVTGYIPDYTNTTLYSGWSLVGYPSLTEKTVSEVLAGTGYDVIEGFNATAPYRLSPIDATYMMKPGEAYWVHVPVNTQWIVDW